MLEQKYSRDMIIEMAYQSIAGRIDTYPIKESNGRWYVYDIKFKSHRFNFLIDLELTPDDSEYEDDYRKYNRVCITLLSRNQYAADPYIDSKKLISFHKGETIFFTNGLYELEYLVELREVVDLVKIAANRFLNDRLDYFNAKILNIEKF